MNILISRRVPWFTLSLSFSQSLPRSFSRSLSLFRSLSLSMYVCARAYVRMYTRMCACVCMRVLCGWWAGGFPGFKEVDPHLCLSTLRFDSAGYISERQRNRKAECTVTSTPSFQKCGSNAAPGARQCLGVSRRLLGELWVTLRRATGSGI